MSSTNEERLDGALKRFQTHPIISRLREFLVRASDEELFHIDPTQLAKDWNVRRRTVLEIFLRAVRHEWRAGGTIKGVDVLNHPA